MDEIMCFALDGTRIMCYGTERECRAYCGGASKYGGLDLDIVRVRDAVGWYLHEKNEIAITLTMSPKESN